MENPSELCRTPDPFRKLCQSLLVALGLLAATVIAYSPALRATYIWDDDDYVVANPTLKSVEGLRQIWFVGGATPQYYPLVHTTFWLEYRLWGIERPLGFHLVNVLLHGLSAFVLWRLVRKLGIRGALLAAAIFALHPVMTESVAWITERKNVLSCLLYLCSALAYFHFAEARQAATDQATATRRLFSPRFGFYLLSFVLFVLAMFSKTVVVSLPAAILVIVWWRNGRLRLRDATPLLPFFAVGLGLGLFTSWMERVRVGAHGRAWDFTFVDRCLIAGRALWFYAAKLVWPVKLAFIYPKWHIDRTQLWQYAFPIAAVLAIMALWLLRRKIGRGALAATLIFAGTLFPALGFFNVFPMLFSFVADHFQYHASIALIVLFAATVAQITAWPADALARFRKAPLLLVAAARWIIPAVVALPLVACLGTITHLHSQVFRDIGTLWLDTLGKNPDSPMVLTSAASVLVSNKQVDEAMALYQKTIRLAPDDAVAQFNLGKLYLERDKLDDAVRHLLKSVELEPRCAHCHQFLGTAYAKKEQVEKALFHLRRAVRIDPTDSAGQFNYATCLQSVSEFDEAIVHYRAALRMKPDWADAHVSIGDCLMFKRKVNEAVEEFRQALRIKPGWQEAESRLQAIRQMQGRSR